MIDLIKFIHLLSIMGLLGTTVWAFIQSFAPLLASQQQGQAALLKPSTPKAISFLPYLILLAMISGTLLIYPKHYTLHTPWIRAAYVLLGLFVLGTWTLRGSKWRVKFITPLVYSALIAILLLIVHDAITKTTFIFS